MATGKVTSAQSNQVVVRQRVGPNWCEVHIHVAIENEEKLLRPYSLSKTFGDAYEATIAWHMYIFVITYEIYIK